MEEERKRGNAYPGELPWGGKRHSFSLSCAEKTRNRSVGEPAEGSLTLLIGSRFFFFERRKREGDPRQGERREGSHLPSHTLRDPDAKRGSPPLFPLKRREGGPPFVTPDCTSPFDVQKVERGKLRKPLLFLLYRRKKKVPATTSRSEYEKP
jgi:hypothetical protein